MLDSFDALVLSVVKSASRCLAGGVKTPAINASAATSMHSSSGTDAAFLFGLDFDDGLALDLPFALPPFLGAIFLREAIRLR